MSENLAISIRQPWAWLIVNGYKDVENRTWHTQVRGRVWVHAAKTMTHEDYLACVDFCAGIGFPMDEFPFPNRLKRGGIVGSVDILDSTRLADSKWFTGPVGFVLANPRSCEFQPMRGQLGFFWV